MPALATLSELVGFFSYSRSDDRESDGSLTLFRRRIQNELRAQLGRSERTMRLWQDVEAIPPGTLWEAEIATAIAQSVFFIPLVTPRALKSTHCAKEFQKFLDREKELGRADLVFPIIYIDIPKLKNSKNWHEDPILKVIGARQYVDWSDFRFEPDQPTVRRAIAKFCSNIIATLEKDFPGQPHHAQAPIQELEKVRGSGAADPPTLPPPLPFVSIPDNKEDAVATPARPVPSGAPTPTVQSGKPGFSLDLFSWLGVDASISSTVGYIASFLLIDGVCTLASTLSRAFYHMFRASALSGLNYLVGVVAVIVAIGLLKNKKWALIIGPIVCVVSVWLSLANAGTFTYYTLDNWVSFVFDIYLAGVYAVAAGSLIFILSGSALTRHILQTLSRPIPSRTAFAIFVAGAALAWILIKASQAIAVPSYTFDLALITALSLFLVFPTYRRFLRDH